MNKADFQNIDSVLKAIHAQLSVLSISIARVEEKLVTKETQLARLEKDLVDTRRLALAAFVGLLILDKGSALIGVLLK